VDEFALKCHVEQGIVQGTYRLEHIFLILIMLRVYLPIRLLRDSAARMLKRSVPIAMRANVSYTTTFVAKYAFYR
jgi:hypothetical protein